MFGEDGRAEYSRFRETGTETTSGIEHIFARIVQALLFFPCWFKFQCFSDLLAAQEAKPAATNYFVKLVSQSADKIVTSRFAGTSAKIVAAGNFQLSATRPSEIYAER